MPPQLEGPGCRPGPIATQKTGEAEEVKSNECEKKPPEEHKEASTGTTGQYRASQKEANNRKAELAARGVSQQTALTGKLKTVRSGNEKPPNAEVSAEVMRDFREVNSDTGRGKPPNAEVSAEVMGDFREVNDDAGRGKPHNAEVRRK